MSTEIINNEIIHTRGDTLRSRVDIFYDKEKTQPYVPEDGDIVRFALKRPKLVRDEKGYKEYEDEQPLILKDIPTDTLILHLEPADTKSLGFGKYEYDVEITHSDGTVDTFIKAAPMTLTKEVH